MKINQDNASHMTKMTAMPIYGKNTLKIFLPGTTELILMKLCMKHQRPYPFILCSNHDPWLAFTYLMARSILQLRLLCGKCHNDGFFGIDCFL